jgi:hypothetical protein
MQDAGSAPEEAERRIRALTERAEIHDLMMRYCRGADRCDEALVAGCFHNGAGREARAPGQRRRSLSMRHARPIGPCVRHSPGRVARTTLDDAAENRAPGLLIVQRPTPLKRRSFFHDFLRSSLTR